jgi:uncharacterized repeat protein (TIGR01451 family)
VASADLSISKTDGQTSRAPGSFTYYLITVSNNGPSSVAEANVTDSFPANLSCNYTSFATGGASGNATSGSGNIADTLFFTTVNFVATSEVRYVDPVAVGTSQFGTNSFNLTSTAPLTRVLADVGIGNAQFIVQAAQLDLAGNFTRVNGPLTLTHLQGFNNGERRATRPASSRRSSSPT